jgi:carbon starvation protein
MASIVLIIGATIILKVADKRRYMLTCLIPLMLIFGLIIIITAIKNWNQNWNNPALAMQLRSA